MNEFFEQIKFEIKKIEKYQRELTEFASPIIPDEYKLLIDKKIKVIPKYKILETPESKHEVSFVIITLNDLKVWVKCRDKEFTIYLSNPTSFDYSLIAYNQKLFTEIFAEFLKQLQELRLKCEEFYLKGKELEELISLMRGGE